MDGWMCLCTYGCMYLCMCVLIQSILDAGLRLAFRMLCCGLISHGFGHTGGTNVIPCTRHFFFLRRHNSLTSTSSVSAFSFCTDIQKKPKHDLPLPYTSYIFVFFCFGVRAFACIHYFFILQPTINYHNNKHDTYICIYEVRSTKKLWCPRFCKNTIF